MESNSTAGYGEKGLVSSQFSKEKKYWLKKLSGDLEKSIFPYDYHKIKEQIKEQKKEQNREQNKEFATLEFRIDNELYEQLMKVAKGVLPKLHIMLMTALAVYMHRCTNNTDIIVGTPIYKQQSGVEYINTVLAVRSTVDPKMTFKECLFQQRDTIVEANENQNYPIETLLQKLGMPYNGTEFPLFDVALVLEDAQLREYLREIHINIQLCFRVNNDTIEGDVIYNNARYRESTIRQFVGGFQQILKDALTDPNKPVWQLEIMTEAEKKKILVDYNRTAVPPRFTGTLHRLFEQQAARTPENIAVISQRQDAETAASGKPDVIEESVTYEQLNKKANQLAHHLKKLGVKKGSVVGIMQEPNIDMTVGLLGILKTGGAYLPIDTGLPEERVTYMLENAGAEALITTGRDIKDHSYTALQGIENNPGVRMKITPPRKHIEAFDQLPTPDRGFLNLKNYKNKIGMASVTNCISLQATRGCPYHCLYCHKIWSKHHVYRDAENIYNEIEYYYKNGVTNFAFIDDCFNLNLEKSRRLFQLIIKNKLKLQLFFPNGLRGDIMPPDYIDMMVEAGTRGINLSLETASPRMQKLLKKYLDLDKFKNVVDYIASQHPRVILEMASMHGFPGETEEEAKMTLDFIKSIKWLHFPYIHILKIFPNTEMEEFALEQGINKADIMRSKDRAFHELPETLPFPKSFTRKYQADFLNNYFLDKDRLMQVLPHQMKVLNETALVQKYNAYLPTEIKKIEDIIAFAGLEELTVPQDYRQEINIGETIFDRTWEKQDTRPGAKRVLLLDLSQHFSSHSMLYRVVEQPLGLTYLATHLKRTFGDMIECRVIKSGNDFDSFEELNEIIDDYRPDLIGLRTLTFFKEFFHETVANIRQWGVTVPIITGGPYASSDYDTILKDDNVDLVVFGEGEYTTAELVEEMFRNEFRLPGPDVLDGIEGIAYKTVNRKTNEKENEKENSSGGGNRRIFLLDRMKRQLEKENTRNLDVQVDDSDLSYIMYTSGSTGRPKGVMVEHRHVNNNNTWMQEKFELRAGDIVVNRTNTTFDPSVWEIFWPLKVGATAKVLDNYLRKDAEYLIRLMEEEKNGTILYAPATLFNIMTYLLDTREEKPRLKLPNLLIGAEPVAMEMVKAFYKYYDGKIFNTYGPTECAINNTYYDLERDDPRPTVPIGKPIANNQIYILDANRQPVPLKVAGEIYIAGDSVVRGYVNDREKTGAAFLDNPFGKGKYFKTGDIGRWLEDGTIEIMGRIDEQVKIRGYRIELGEIESVLAAHSAVKECVVTVNTPGDAAAKVGTCKKCGITTRYPAVTINDDGVCNVCDLYSRTRKHIDDYFKTPQQMEQVIREAGEKKESDYDLLLLYAGGRGSAYALYRLVEQGFKVMTVTYDNGYFSKADIDNIKRITASLGVENEVLTHKNSDKILGESINTAATVCRGCFHTSSSLAAKYAAKHRIPIVVGATLSRGQIIENRLFMFLQQGITDQEELEKEILKVQRGATEFDKSLFDLIDIQEVTDGTVYENVKIIDFYRYNDVANTDMIEYLNRKDPYWKKRKNFAVYSTNCAVKQMGDYGHLEEKGFHYYGGATGWERRLGHLTLENVDEDLNCNATKQGYERFLERIGIQPKKTGESREKYLCAYYVPAANETEGLETELREQLEKKLPPYMLPKYMVRLDEIPLTNSGKVDKKALPEPRRTAARKATYVAPKTDMEVVIAEVWKDVLKIDRVGTEDNFFDLGGSSLDIVMVGSRLKERTQKEIPVVTLFTYTTIAGIARHLEELQTENPGQTETQKKEVQTQKLNKSKNKMKQNLSKMKKFKK